MPVPVHELATTEQYLAVLDGYPTEVPCRRAVRLLQRRLRRAGAARRARERRAVPRARAHRVLRAGRHGRHRVPALRRAAGARRARATSTIDGAADATCSTSRCAAAATAGSTRPLADVSALLERVLRRPDRVGGVGRRDGAAAQRRAGGVEALRPRLLAARVERRRHGWRATTPACRSAARTTRTSAHHATP